MNPSIGSMVSNIFYKDQLQNKKSEMFLPEKDLPYFLVPEVSWIDTAHLGPKAKESKEKDPYGRETKSFLNKQEITQILSLLEQMEMSESTLACLRDFHSKTSEPPIGVICSYAGQKRELLRRFRQKPHSDEFRQLVKIDTVDSYQGKENLIIILSLVRSNAAGNSGFLNQPERINVAVSRAMERLLIVGDGLMWKNTESPLGNIYSYIQAREQDDHKFTILKLSA
jgi:superfamily I DNA and/or RNA helicase